MRHQAHLVLVFGLVGCATDPTADPSAGSDGTIGEVVAAALATRPVTLQTAVGQRFVSAENGGGGDVHADRAVASGWETFTLNDLNGGDLQSGDSVTLATANGHFLCAENGGGGAVNATRTAAAGWETFRVIKIGGGGAIHDGDQIALQTVTTGQYLSAINGGGGLITADRPAIQGWEAFVVGGNGGHAGWNPTWSDEFDAGANTPVDGNKWGYDTGGGGWGNNELENYTSRTDNVRHDGAGHLEIVARRENFGGNAYTSGRINTGGRFTQAYGRFEARVKMPQGSGIWPAFWTLGDNIGAPNVGWPQCGELDIMEAAIDFRVNHGSAHGPGYSGGSPLTGTWTIPSGRLGDDYHVYAMEWEPGVVRWYVDDNLYETRTPADVPPGKTWVYDHPFFIIMNVAVGGNWPGTPDASATFPQTMSVDYVRVYSR